MTFVELPDYVNFTDWAEDGYVSLAANGVSFLMEPWEFPRSGDTLIAEAVQSVTGIKTGQAPLIFQGGNCLIGDDFWLLGKDYFADSIRLAGEQGGPVSVPQGMAPDAFVAQLFSEFVDTKRRLIVVGTNKRIPLRGFYGTREGSRYFLDIASDGAGTFQPIFHIDMLITLVGMGAGAFEVFVGSPALADSLLGLRRRSRWATSTKRSRSSCAARDSPFTATRWCISRRKAGALRSMSCAIPHSSRATKIWARLWTNSGPRAPRPRSPRGHGITSRGTTVLSRKQYRGQNVYMPTYGGVAPS